MRKSVQISLLVLSLAALLIIGGTMAWFTATAEPVTNEFTAGTVEIEIIDVYNEVDNWNPGDCTSKEVGLKYTGSKKAYVRVKFDVAWAKEGSESELPITNIRYKRNGDEFQTVAGMFGEDWVYNEGWYYYKGIVEPDTWGEENPLMLIDHVCLDGEDTGNEYQGATLTINVEAEAVQASNNAYQSVWWMTKLPWENGDNGEDNGGAA